MAKKSKLTKQQLENLQLIRQFGINDLKKYKEKIDKNINVFKDAIKKENTEKRRITKMIQVLEKDIEVAESLKKSVR